MLTRNPQPGRQSAGSKRAESGTCKGRRDQKSQASVAGKDSRPARQDACEGSQPLGRVERKITSPCRGEPREPAGEGRGRETFPGERGTVASRIPGRQRWCPCNSELRRARGVLGLFSHLGPRATQWSGCSPCPSALRVCRLWAPSLLPALCTADPTASFAHSAPQIRGEPKTEDLDPRPERRRRALPHAALQGRDL